MITIITNKPTRSIDIIGHGLDSYKDKDGKTIWRVYGIVSPGSRGRLVNRDSNIVKDLYIDDTTIIIFRSEDKDKAIICKDFIDRHIATKAPVFGVEEFKLWLKENLEKVVTDAEVVNTDEANSGV